MTSISRSTGGKLQGHLHSNEPWGSHRRSQKGAPRILSSSLGLSQDHSIQEKKSMKRVYTIWHILSLGKSIRVVSVHGNENSHVTGGLPVCAGARGSQGPHTSLWKSVQSLQSGNISVSWCRYPLQVGDYSFISSSGGLFPHWRPYSDQHLSNSQILKYEV